MNSARCIKLIIAYDGTEFFGWQRQSAARTVQATLEDALALTTGAPRVRLLASSRTDTGVHAIGQCATFRSFHWQAPAANLALAVNTRLPPDVIVRSACEVPMSFNPIRSALGKRYRYSIYASRVSDPLARRQTWWVKRLLDIDDMRRAAAHLIGTHDFASFQTSGSPRISTIRSVRAIDIECQSYLDGQRITIEVEANGFLYNMVRNIVGTLVFVGRGRRTHEWVVDALAALDRKQTGQTAPAQGLCLQEIFFDPASHRMDQSRLAVEHACVEPTVTTLDTTALTSNDEPFDESLDESEPDDIAELE